MSMMSQQAKALRSWADQLAEREDEFGVVVRALVADLREAADTIDGLRDRLHESYGQVPEQGKCENGDGRESYSHWHQLFGTPERAMRVIALIGDRYPCDDGCDPLGEKCKVCPFADAPSCRIDRDHPEESPLLEWLRGDA